MSRLTRCVIWIRMLVFIRPALHIIIKIITIMVLPENWPNAVAVSRIPVNQRNPRDSITTMHGSIFPQIMNTIMNRNVPNTMAICGVMIVSPLSV